MPQESTEGVSFFGAVVTGGYEPPGVDVAN